jgi:hypothetical protein
MTLTKGERLGYLFGSSRNAVVALVTGAKGLDSRQGMGIPA